jgi:hypothetical protein
MKASPCLAFLGSALAAAILFQPRPADAFFATRVMGIECMQSGGTSSLRSYAGALLNNGASLTYAHCPFPYSAPIESHVNTTVVAVEVEDTSTTSNVHSYTCLNPIGSVGFDCEPIVSTSGTGVKTLIPSIASWQDPSSGSYDAWVAVGLPQGSQLFRIFFFY